MPNSTGIPGLPPVGGPGLDSPAAVMTTASPTPICVHSLDQLGAQAQHPLTASASSAEKQAHYQFTGPQGKVMSEATLALSWTGSGTKFIHSFILLGRGPGIPQLTD